MRVLGIELCAQFGEAVEGQLCAHPLRQGAEQIPHREHLPLAQEVEAMLAKRSAQPESASR